MFKSCKNYTSLSFTWGNKDAINKGGNITLYRMGNLHCNIHSYINCNPIVSHACNEEINSSWMHLWFLKNEILQYDLWNLVRRNWKTIAKDKWVTNLFDWFTQGCIFSRKIPPPPLCSHTKYICAERKIFCMTLYAELGKTLFFNGKISIFLGK